MAATRKVRTVLASAVLVAVLFVSLAFVAGCMRYGGAEGLLQKARAEVAERRPHPLFVPTPLAETPAAPLVVARTTGTAVPRQTLSPEAPIPVATATISPTAEAPSRIMLPSVQSEEPADPIAEALPTASPIPVATATPAYAPAAERVALTGLSHMWQTWNNCGPATLAMDLSYYGSRLDQADVAAELRPDKDDKNVNPDEMAYFARSQGYHALVRANGDTDRLRLLLSNGVPVLIETWLEPKPNDGMGHYRLLTGYDDAQREWIIYDAYVSTGVDPDRPYAGIRSSYEELDRLWAVFNRTYLVVFDDDHAAQVAAILGEDADDRRMWERALARHLDEVETAPDDAFVSFDLGTDLVALGRYDEAAAAYDQARRTGLPWRMLWYQFGPFKAYYEAGRYQEVIALVDATLKIVDNVEELYYWRGLALKANGDLAGAREAWQRALALNAHFTGAQQALAELGQ